jgi:polysaccharide biosynthesis/export protein
MKKVKIIVILCFIYLFPSCVPQKSMVYFQGSQNFNNVSTNYEALVQYDDLLFINVSSLEPEAAIPFNLDAHIENANSANSFPIQRQTYLVDNFGNIEFPVIGTLNVAGFTLNQLKEKLIEKISVYVRNPIINIRIMNFKVSVLGEVVKPNTYTVGSLRLTFPEALAMAGDLTPYGKRENIILIRDFQGVKTYNRINITKADFVNSPFYYLDQNDVIYVEARNAKANNTAVSSNVTSIASLLGILVTLSIILLYRK